jgi:hypothetical protein
MPILSREEEALKISFGECNYNQKTFVLPGDFAANKAILENSHRSLVK